MRWPHYLWRRPHPRPSLLYERETALTWLESMLDGPVVWFNINGDPLAYEYSVVTPEREVFARLMIAADRRLGTTLMSFERDPRRWDIAAGMSRACELAFERFPGYGMTGVFPVLYDGLQAGAMAIISDPTDGEVDRIIINLDTMAPTPNITLNSGSEPVVTEYDFLSSSLLLTPDHTNIEGLRKHWQIEDDWAARVVEAFCASGVGISDLKHSPLGQLIDPKMLEDILPFDCEIHVTQARKYFNAKVGCCTVGVARMIASHDHQYHKEAEVMKAMGIPICSYSS